MLRAVFIFKFLFLNLIGDSRSAALYSTYLVALNAIDESLISVHTSFFFYFINCCNLAICRIEEMRQELSIKVAELSKT